jgi:uncharacterized DUF497 family protein
VGGGIEFDWDDANIRHLNRHRVSPHEFEEVIGGDPFDLEYLNVNGEDRFKIVGATLSGRVLIGVWTPREGRIRPVTAYEASRKYLEMYYERGG